MRYAVTLHQEIRKSQGSSITRHIVEADTPAEAGLEAQRKHRDPRASRKPTILMVVPA
jgi:hypothetical protein